MTSTHERGLLLRRYRDPLQVLLLSCSRAFTIRPMDHLPRRMALIAIAVVLTMAFGTVGFVVIEGYTPFEAFYMTLTTVTTVGYGEIRTLSHAGRVFNSFLIVFGVTVIFLGVGAITQTAIELELNQFFGKRRGQKMIERLYGHYIVCGFCPPCRRAFRETPQTGGPLFVVHTQQKRVQRAL